MILVIDNYDSFTYNLVQYLGELGADPRVYRNDEISLQEIEVAQPHGILLSPGPKRPEDTEPTNAIVERFQGKIPIFGVCLGLQCMAYVHGAKVGRAERLMHGKTSPVFHSGHSVLQGLTSPFEATRYHSLIVDRESIPAEFEVIAWTAEDEVMGLAHRELQLWGVQFHPESILTEGGLRVLYNFLALAQAPMHEEALARAQAGPASRATS